MNLTFFENIILKEREINIPQFHFYITEDSNLFAILLFYVAALDWKM